MQGHIYIIQRYCEFSVSFNIVWGRRHGRQALVVTYIPCVLQQVSPALMIYRRSTKNEWMPLVIIQLYFILYYLTSPGLTCCPTLGTYVTLTCVSRPCLLPHCVGSETRPASTCCDIYTLRPATGQPCPNELQKIHNNNKNQWMLLVIIQLYFILYYHDYLTSPGLTCCPTLGTYVTLTRASRPCLLPHCMGTETRPASTCCDIYTLRPATVQSCHNLFLHSFNPVSRKWPGYYFTQYFTCVLMFFEVFRIIRYHILKSILLLPYHCAYVFMFLVVCVYVQDTCQR